MVNERTSNKYHDNNQSWITYSKVKLTINRVATLGVKKKCTE